MKITAYARATLGALALSVLAGCSGTTNFTISEELVINGLGSQTDTIDVSLSQVAGDAWKHRDKIKDAKITAATAVIRQVFTDDNTATSVAGSASLTGTGGTATFASGTAAVAVGSTHAAQNLDATGDILKKALKGDGNVQVAYTAAPTPPGAKTHIKVEVLIDVEVDWSVF
jgi:outer membrane murein-binding lipoprotein Lpp